MLTQPIVVCSQWQTASFGSLNGEACERRLAGGRRWTAVSVCGPGNCFSSEIEIVGKGTTREKVALDPFDQRLDAALLVGSRRVTGLRMEVEFAGEVEQSRCPEGVVGGVPAARDRF